MVLFNQFIKSFSYIINDECGEESGNNINKVMCLNINRGTTKQEIKREKIQRQPSIGTISQNHQYGRNTYV